VSHYHFDHHTPSFEDWFCNWTSGSETARQIYEGKIVLAKNPRTKINYSQRRRGWMFQKTGGRYAKKIEIADGRTFIFRRSTKVRFSRPVFHGTEDSGLGWVLMVTIECQGEKIMFASDVQGPMCSLTRDLILEEKPHVLMIGGPPLYLSGFKVKEEQIQKGIENLEELVEAVPVTILEHHILRDRNWRENVESVFERAEKSGHRVITAAESIGKRDRLLEAFRRQLFHEKPPSQSFTRWTQKPREGRRCSRPPIIFDDS